MNQGRVGPGLVLIASVIVVMLFSLASVAAQTSTPSAAEHSSGQPVIVFYPADDSNMGFINVELDPGEEGEVEVVLGNGGSSDFEAVTYAADAYTLRNGGFSVREYDSPVSGPTTWLDYPTETFTAEIENPLVRKFSISVPVGTPAGEYVTGISMQAVDPVGDADEGGDVRLSQYMRTIIGVRILVPGDLEAEFTIGVPSFQSSGTGGAIVLPLTNVGNVQASPSGEVRISTASGEIVVSAPVQLGRIYGGHETELWLGLGEPLPNGDYQISVVLEDEESGLRAELLPTTFAVSGTEDTDQASVSFTTTSIAPMPAEDNVQFLQVDTTITNATDEPVANAQLSLIAMLDGEEVERFPISQSLSVSPGETEVTTRYIPMTGWTSGEWEFELLLETVEGSGAAVVVDRAPLDTKVTVP